MVIRLVRIALFHFHKFNGNFVAAIGHVPRGVVTHKKEFATGF
jgi:hypothetical protein